MKRVKFFLSLFVVVFALAATMPACKTLDTILNKKSSPKPKAKKPTKVKKVKTTPPKKVEKPKAEKSETKVKSKTEPEKEAEAVEVPIYEPPLRGSPKSRVGGGTR